MDNSSESASQRSFKLEESKQLLVPSLLSGVITTLLVAFIVGNVLAQTFSLYFFEINYFGSAQTVNDPSLNKMQLLVEAVNHSQASRNLATFFFWGIIGLMSWLLISSIQYAVSRSIEIKKEATYVNAGRQNIVKTELNNAAIRLVIAVVWLIYAWLFTRFLLPYASAAAWGGAGELNRPAGVIYLLTAICVLWISIHVHTVFMRLLTLKLRVLSGVMD